MQLADRIEALDGSSREIDWAIFCLIQPDRLPFYEEKLAEIRAEAEENGIWALRSGAVIQGQRDLFCPRYTASIDAVMTLVPDGDDWAWTISKVAPRGPTAWWAQCSDVRRPDANIMNEALSTTPVLALCAAALRARDASEVQTEPATPDERKA